MEEDNHSLQFFKSAHQNFKLAISNVQEIRRYYKIGIFTFCLRFAGKAMLDALTLALSHLEVDVLDQCDLTICIWDSASTFSPPIQFPWTNNSLALRGEVVGYNNEHIHTVVDIHTKVLNVFDRNHHLALYWIKDHKEIPWWIEGSPFQLIFHWWAKDRGYQLTHAAAVGYSKGGVLLAGKGGAGKSTTTLACMKAGMKYLSEDYCLISSAPDVWIYSLYNSAKLQEKTLNWFPELRKYVKNSQRAEGEKAFLFHHTFQPEKIIDKFPLKAVLTLNIEEAKDSWLEPIEPTDAIAPLTISTLWQLTHTGPTDFNHLKYVTFSVPCYKLHVGSDLMRVPQLIEEVL